MSKPRFKHYNDIYRMLNRVTDVVHKHSDYLVVNSTVTEWSGNYKHSLRGIDFSKYNGVGQLRIHHDEIPYLSREYLSLMQRRRFMVPLDTERQWYALEHKGYLIIKAEPVPEDIKVHFNNTMKERNKPQPYAVYDSRNELVLEDYSDKNVHDIAENILLKLAYRG